MMTTQNLEEFDGKGANLGRIDLVDEYNKNDKPPTFLPIGFLPTDLARREWFGWLPG